VSLYYVRAVSRRGTPFRNQGRCVASVNHHENVVTPADLSGHTRRVISTTQIPVLVVRHPDVNDHRQASAA
jgi:hypothetical protein